MEMGGDPTSSPKYCWSMVHGYIFSVVWFNF